MLTPNSQLPTPNSQLPTPLVAFSLVVGILAVVACEKEQTQSQPEDLNPGNSSLHTKELIASSLSQLIEDPETLRFLVNECAKKKTGEREVLYVNLKDMLLPEGVTVAQKLSELNPGLDGDFFTKQAVVNDPFLVLGLHQPLGLSEDDLVTANADIEKIYVFHGEPKNDIPYFIDGHPYVNESGSAEVVPVLVIAESDRVQLDQDFSGNVSRVHEVASFEAATYYYPEYPSLVHIDEYVGTYGAARDYSDPLVGRVPMRDQLPAAYDIVQRVLFKEFLDSWWHSRMELEVRMIGKSSGVIRHNFDLFKHQKNDWVFLDDDAPTIVWKWDKEAGNEGDRVLYHFSDRDGGGGSKFKVSYTTKVKEPKSGIEVSTTISAEFGEKKDDFLGSGYEYYRNWVRPDSWGNLHRSGEDWRFWINISEP